MGFTLAPATHALIGVQTTEVGISTLPEYTLSTLCSCIEMIYINYLLRRSPLRHRTVSVIRRLCPEHIVQWPVTRRLCLKFAVATHLT